MFCSVRCFNNSNVAKNNSEFTNKEKIGIIICDHQTRDLLSCGCCNDFIKL